MASRVLLASSGARQAMPQLAEMDRGTGISRPGSPNCPHSRSMVMAAVVVGKVATSHRVFSRCCPLTAG